jgi:hypothetical protein
MFCLYHVFLRSVVFEKEDGIDGQTDAPTAAAANTFFSGF